MSVELKSAYDYDPCFKERARLEHPAMPPEAIDRATCRGSAVESTPASDPVTIAQSFADRGVYADLVTAPGFKPGVASEKGLGGFDSHPLPLSGFRRSLASPRTVSQLAARSRVRAAFPHSAEVGRAGQNGVVLHHILHRLACGFENVRFRDLNVMPMSHRRCVPHDRTHDLDRVLPNQFALT